MGGNVTPQDEIRELQHMFYGASRTDFMDRCFPDTTKERFSSLEKLEGSRIDPCGPDSYVSAEFHFAAIDALEVEIARLDAIVRSQRWFVVSGWLGWTAALVVLAWAMTGGKW